MFQSTPDLVNRENAARASRSFSPSVFQSTPDLVNRENLLICAATAFAVAFQSTPDLVNRENIAPRDKPLIVARVSIHSRFS